MRYKLFNSLKYLPTRYFKLQKEKLCLSIENSANISIIPSKKTCGQHMPPDVAQDLCGVLVKKPPEFNHKEKQTHVR